MNLLIESIAGRSHWAWSAAKKSALAMAAYCSLLAPAAWAQYSPQPNLFELSGRDLEVTYSASSIDGRPRLRYQSEDVDVTFVGDEIDVSELDGGVTLVSVVLDSDEGPSTAAALKPADGDDKDDKDDRRRDDKDDEDKDGGVVVFSLLIPPFELGTGREARVRTIGIFTEKQSADYDSDIDDGALAEFSSRQLRGTARLVDF
jgi:hypothetical protein